MPSPGIYKPKGPWVVEAKYSETSTKEPEVSKLRRSHWPRCLTSLDYSYSNHAYLATTIVTHVYAMDSESSLGTTTLPMKFGVWYAAIAHVPIFGK